jgi:hypothetical protein
LTDLADLDRWDLPIESIMNVAKCAILGAILGATIAAVSIAAVTLAIHIGGAAGIILIVACMGGLVGAVAGAFARWYDS